MQQQYTALPLSKGIDRSVISYKADPASFYQLLNIRQTVNEVGKLEQTPYFSLYTTFTQGTYYASGSQSEPATSAIRLISTFLVMTDYVFWNDTVSTAQLQAFYQNVYPAAETIYTGCRLVINSVTGLGVTLGSDLDVEMTGAAAFRWRKNGGGWTAGVPSTAGVSIDGGNATLYFLANTGFAGTEAWSWVRTDCSFEDSTKVQIRPAQYTFYKNELFFTNTQDRIMVASETTTGVVVVSAGYRPIYGSYLGFFADHMMIGGYSATPVLPDAFPRCRTVGWSDLTDIHCFVPTDVNEADSYVLPINALNDVISTSQAYAPVFGAVELRDQWFVFTGQEVWSTQYLGLPTVFNFTKFQDFATANTFQSVVKAQPGVYVVGTALIAYFDGGAFDSISFPVWSILGLTVNNAAVVGTATVGTDSTFSGDAYTAYDQTRREFSFIRGNTAYVYQELLKAWYTRSLDFDSYTIPVTAYMVSDTLSIFIGLASRKLLIEDIGWAQQPVYDASMGAAYTTPTLITHVLDSAWLNVVKEITGAYFAGEVVTADATYYTTGSNLQFILGWYLTNTGRIPSGSATTDALSIWTTAAVTGTLSKPRVDFRGIALQVQLTTATAARPPGQGIITGLEPLLLNPTRVDR